nr:hypothetical protein [Rothia nasimurium]
MFEVDGVVLCEFFEEVEGDEVAGDDEEDVDADVAAGEVAGPEVVGDDEGDGDCSECLYIAS